MGQSTDAILFYGYCWDEERRSLFDDKGGQIEWVDVIAEQRGLVNPWNDYKERTDLPYKEQRALTDKWADDHRKELDAYYASKRAIREEFGCEVDHHCSGDYPMPFVCVNDSKVHASRGTPEGVVGLDVDPEWDALLEKFMSELGISKPEGQERPGWWLVSYWG